MERIKKISKSVARFFVRLLTARYCEYCSWSYKDLQKQTKCSCCDEDCSECKSSISHSKFERRCSVD